MVSTLKEAREHKMEIRREVRFIAISKDGNHYWLTHDFEVEEVNSQLDRIKPLERELTELRDFVKGVAKNMLKNIEANGATQTKEKG